MIFDYTCRLVYFQEVIVVIIHICHPQRDWVNDYHRKCRETIGVELERQGRKEALDWLMRETQPIV